MSDVAKMLEVILNNVQMTDDERIDLLLEIIDNVIDEYTVVSDIAKSYNLKASDLQRVEASNNWVADQMILAGKVKIDIESKEMDYSEG